MKIGTTTLRNQRGIQSPITPGSPRPELRHDLAAQLQQRHIQVAIGGTTYSGGQLAAMSEAEFNTVCHDAGLDAGDVLQLFDDINLDANQNSTIELTRDGAIARATGLDDGIDGNYGPPTAPEATPAPNAADVLAADRGRLNATHVTQPGWFSRILRAIGDSFVELFTAGHANTWTYNHQPSADELTRMQHLGTELGRQHPARLAAVLEQPGGEAALRQAIEGVHPHEAGWSQASEAVLQGIEHQVQPQRAHLAALESGFSDRAVQNEIAALFAAHAAEPDAMANVEQLLQAPSFRAASSADQLAALRALAAAGCSDAVADAAVAVSGLRGSAQQAGLEALGSTDTTYLTGLGRTVADLRFAALDPRQQAGVLQAARASDFASAPTEAILTVAADPSFAHLDNNTQSRCLRLMRAAAGDTGRLQTLRDILTSPTFASLSGPDRQRTLGEIEAGIRNPAVLNRIHGALDVRAEGSIADMQAASRRFGISRNQRAAILGQLRARHLRFTYRHNGTTYTIRPEGPHNPAHGEVSLASIFNSRHPEAAMARALPGLDPRDFGTLLVGVAESNDFDAQIDVSPGSLAAQRFHLNDGVDGNALTGQAAHLTSAANLQDFVSRMRDHGIDMSYEHHGQTYVIDAAGLQAVLGAADPAQAAAQRWPGLNFANFERFLGDLSTVRGRNGSYDPLAVDIDLSARRDFARANLFRNRPYNARRAQTALRNTLYDYSVTFVRGAQVSGVLDAPQVTATAAQSAAVQRGRTLVAASGPTEESYASASIAFYTRDLLARIHKSGRLGAALASSANYANRGDRQLATLSGDPRVLDSIPPEHTHVLLMNSSHFPEDPSLSDTLPDVQKLRRALTRTGPHGPGIPDANVTVLSNPRHDQAAAAIASQIEQAQAGDAVVVYVSTHGNDEGVYMSDDGAITNDTINAMYGAAEARGVRLVMVEETCLSGAQADSVRAQEIQRLQTAGRAPAQLQPAEDLRNGLVALGTDSGEYGNRRHNVPPDLRLFSSGQLASWLGRALAKQGQPPHVSGGDSLLTMLRADPHLAPRLARLQARAHALIHKATTTNLTKQEQSIIDYADCIEHLSNDVEDIETPQCRLLNAGHFANADRLDHLVHNGNLMGSGGTLTALELVQLIDNADSSVNDLIAAANKGTP